MADVDWKVGALQQFRADLQAIQAIQSIQANIERFECWLEEREQ